MVFSFLFVFFFLYFFFLSKKGEEKQKTNRKVHHVLLIFLFTFNLFCFVNVFLLDQKNKTINFSMKKGYILFFSLGPKEYI
jgi:hypothetical protein